MASDWGKRVAKALRDPAVVNGIATLVGRYAKQHIATSRGRDESGGETALQPLAAVKGEYWTTTKPKDSAAIKATRTVVVVRQRKMNKQIMARYKFEFRQGDTLVYEGEQTAMWLKMDEDAAASPITSAV